MRDIVIHIEGMSKRFPTHPDAIALGLRPRRQRDSDWHWALRDVSFDVYRGESVGLLGENGAGKTTLLRILARITRPTCGFADLHGTVGAVLEVGAGCHGELTGRENIFLDGALLGMQEPEIRAKFDAIVAFSGIGDAIDTPYKWYSSGMQARLGFSIAVHLESDILLVDEALAVGDAGFRERGAERMRALIESERTVLFTGHQLATMKRVCDRVVWLDKGRVRAIGEPQTLIDEYLSELAPDAAERALLD